MTAPKNNKHKHNKGTTPTKGTQSRPPSDWEKQKAEREAREAREKLAQAARAERVAEQFEPEWLKWICEAHETHFEETFGMTKVEVDQQAPHDYYYFKDNGSDILAVAHLDTVIDHARRMCDFAETAAGPIVFSGSLDDRLGAYIILKLLPALGLEFDILLTVGEESAQSTAVFFDPPEDKEYLWGIEFDRGGNDVVMYDYEDHATANLVRDCGARVGKGSFSDIAYLEHLEVKMFNWGVAYRDYHGPRGHAWLDETFNMVGHFLKFHETNKDDYLPHEKKRYSARGRGRGGASTAWGGGAGYGQYGNGGWWDRPGREVDEGDSKEVMEYAKAIDVKIDKAEGAELWKENLVGRDEWVAGWPAPTTGKVNVKAVHVQGDGQEYTLADGSTRTAVGHQVLWRKAIWEKRQKADPEWSPANYMTKEEWTESTTKTKEVEVYGGDCEECGCPVIAGFCSERCELDRDLPLFGLFCEECGRRKISGACPDCDLDDDGTRLARCGLCGYIFGGLLCKETCGPPTQDGEAIEDAVIDNPTTTDLAYLESVERNQRLLRAVD